VERIIGFVPATLLAGAACASRVDSPGINRAEPNKDCLINFLLCDMDCTLESGRQIINFAPNYPFLLSKLPINP
jgi:hypothetical protein